MITSCLPVDIWGGEMNRGSNGENNWWTDLFPRCKGVIRLLIMDREFIDGAMISRFKKIHGIDCLFPLKSNMHALLDALGIVTIERVSWMKYEELKDEGGKLIEVEEVAGVGKAVIVYAERYFAVFDLDEYTDIILDLKEKARERMSLKKFRREKIRAP
jgi:hypothetical protein